MSMNVGNGMSSCPTFRGPRNKGHGEAAAALCRGNGNSSGNGLNRPGWEEQGYSSRRRKKCHQKVLKEGWRRRGVRFKSQGLISPTLGVHRRQLAENWEASMQRVRKHDELSAN